MRGGRGGWLSYDFVGRGGDSGRTRIMHIKSSLVQSINRLEPNTLVKL